jgi:hypothetical protein
MAISRKSTSTSLTQYTFVASKMAAPTASPIAGSDTATLERPRVIASFRILGSMLEPFCPLFESSELSVQLGTFLQTNVS